MKNIDIFLEKVKNYWNTKDIKAIVFAGSYARGQERDSDVI